MADFQKRMARLTPQQRKLFYQKVKEMKQDTDKPEYFLALQDGDPEAKRPIYCLHPPLGVTGYYLNIARHLPDSQPVYGIQSPAFYGLRDPFDNIPEMADSYLEAIRTVQPDGPYIFLGHSSGAYIGYEMAINLQRAGETEALLLILDSEAPIGPLSEIMNAFKGTDIFESVEALFVCAWAVSMVYQKPLTFGMETFAQQSTEERYETVADYFKEAGFIPMNANTQLVRTILHMLANHVQADSAFHEQHTPDGPDAKFEGQTVLMRCTEETLYPGFDVAVPADESPYSNWDKFCSGPIDVIGIPDANHITMVAEPCVATIAEALAPYLD